MFRSGLAHRRSQVGLGIACLVLAAMPATAAVVCTATQARGVVGCLATDPSCVIDVQLEVNDLCMLDFGSQHLDVQANIQEAVDSAYYTIKAGSLTLTSKTIRSLGGDEEDGGSVTIDLGDGAFLMNGTAPSLDADGTMSGAAGGEINLFAGSISLLSGNVTARSQVAEEDGGSIVLDAGTGIVTIDAPVRATSSGGSSTGGSITIAGGSVSVTRELDASGWGFGGGDVDVEARTGDVTIDVRINAQGRQGGGDDGDGGAVTLRAAGDLLVNDHVLVRGAGVDGSGGFATFEVAGSTTLSSTVDGRGGTDGFGAFIGITGTGDVTLESAASLNVAAGREGGSIDITTKSVLDLDGDLLAQDDNAATVPGLNQGGGDVHLDACTVVIGGAIDVGGNETPAGTTSVQAFQITVEAGGAITSAECTGTCHTFVHHTGGGFTNDGVVTPAPAVSSSPSFQPCCGNGVLEPVVSESCDDGNVDYCDGCSGTCEIDAVPACSGDLCLTGACDPETGCEATPPCDDGIFCTLDSCDPAVGCVFTPNDGFCDDAGGCKVMECNLSNGCQQIGSTAAGTPCDDGSVCTLGDACDGAGSCAPTYELNCDDGNECTNDSCFFAFGCNHYESGSPTCTSLCVDPGTDQPLPAGTPCLDQDVCTVGDTCDGAGNCVSGPVRSCDDGDPCTADVCSQNMQLPWPTDGCVHTDNLCQPDCSNPANEGQPCSDLDACTTATCQGGACVATPIQCDDGNPCNGYSQCQATGGDSDYGCVDSAPPLTCGCDPVDCDDGNPCTDDGCDPTGACENVPNAASCDDGNACTVSDVCGAGNCTPGAPLVCDDGAFCNGLETCNPGSGCEAGTPPALDDGNPCTDDACDETNDIVTHDPNSAPCDDGQFCTAVDQCSGGTCVGSGDPCASNGECNDSCNESTNDCAVPAGTPCGTATGLCTDDSCDGSGACQPQTQCMCPLTPGAGCHLAGRSKLALRDVTNDGKDKLKWLWRKGDVVAGSELGDPLAGTQYTLCVYDDDGSAPSLVSSLHLGTAPALWRQTSRGFKYKDKLLASDGVRSFRVYEGAPGRSTAKLSAKGVGVPLPASPPGLPDAYFQQNDRVIVQLVNSVGTCWSVDYVADGSPRNEPTRFVDTAP